MFKRILSIVLTILMLVSNTSVTLAVHYCGGKQVKSSMSFGHEALTCGMVKMDQLFQEGEGDDSSTLREDCCRNEYTKFSVEDDYSSSSENISIQSAIEFSAILEGSFVFLCSLIYKDKLQFTGHSPPVIDQNKSVLFQVFRI